MFFFGINSVLQLQYKLFQTNHKKYLDKNNTAESNPNKLIYSKYILLIKKITFQESSPDVSSKIIGVIIILDWAYFKHMNTRY